MVPISQTKGVRLKTAKSNLHEFLKSPTGIEGFDEITEGGLPRGRTTLLEGGPGSGKTIMALQTLVNGARLNNEPGILVAFEESPERLKSNAAKFGWDLPGLEKTKLFFIDAQIKPDLVQSGSFDLGGLLAAVTAKARAMKARRIVFDAIDVVLALLNDPVAERREIYRLHDWLLASGLTGIITSKAGSLYRYDVNAANRPQSSFMQFMVDCVVELNHDVVDGVSQRNLRVVKYRGSSFSENESPFLIGPGGIQVAGAREAVKVKTSVSRERVSSGVKRLDAMLGGGYYRNASMLITGVPGTAKSTLAGAFAEAACQRGDRTLFVSFDSDANEVVRNLTSVNIRLERYVKKGLLRLIWERSITGSAEIHLMRIKKAAREHGARCVVIDPVSALSKSGDRMTASSVAERLLDWSKTNGVTLLCTSLLVDAGTQVEGTPLQISTLSDTWIHLNYLVRGGERNRGLSIVKSRGTSHSNQVRELILSDSGVTLADAYTAGGEVLMGTMRWEKELAVRTDEHEKEALAKQKKATLDLEEAELEARLRAVQLELEAKRLQKNAVTRSVKSRDVELMREKKQLRALRGVGEA
jgi:circadian clock protein KaiC